MGNCMSDMPSLDPDLTRLFDEARTSLPAEAFMEQLHVRLTHARHLRLGLQVSALALLAALAIAVTPYAARVSLTAADALGRWLPFIGEAMGSPLGWAGSLLVGAWVLRRSHVFGR
jgi:hypothetical protein